MHVWRARHRAQCGALIKWKARATPDALAIHSWRGIGDFAQGVTSRVCTFDGRSAGVASGCSRNGSGDDCAGRSKEEAGWIWTEIELWLVTAEIGLAGVGSGCAVDANGSIDARRGRGLSCCLLAGGIGGTGRSGARRGLAGIDWTRMGRVKDEIEIEPIKVCARRGTTRVAVVDRSGRIATRRNRMGGGAGESGDDAERPHAADARSNWSIRHAGTDYTGRLLAARKSHSNRWRR
jgi:hypothetical protein